MTPEQLGLVLVPLIASKGSMSREPQTIAMLLEHREPTFGRDLDVEMQAGLDWLIANGTSHAIQDRAVARSSRSHERAASVGPQAELSPATRRCRRSTAPIAARA